VQVEEVSVARVPVVFKFQARVSQAKLPVGEGEFQTVFVKLSAAGEVLCEEKFPNVPVKNSVLNLTIGHHMNCSLQEVIAENEDLNFEICLGSSSSCLKEVALSSTPYAVKSSFAVMAQRAHRASMAATANYAQRVTADRDLHLRKALGTGYFDFYTPAVGNNPLDATDATINDGWIQWTPVRSTTAKKLHVAGKRHLDDKIELLDAIILHAVATQVEGTLHVAGNSTLQGDVTAKSAVFVEGETTFNSGHASAAATVRVGSAGALIESGAPLTVSSTTAGEDLRVGGDATYVSIGEEGVDATGTLHLQRAGTGSVSVQNDLSVNGTLTVSGNTTLEAVTAGNTVTFKEAPVFEKGFTLPPGVEVGTSDPSVIKYGNNTGTTPVTLASTGLKASYAEVSSIHNGAGTVAVDSASTFASGKQVTFNGPVNFATNSVTWTNPPPFLEVNEGRVPWFQSGAYVGLSGSGQVGINGDTDGFFRVNKIRLAQGKVESIATDLLLNTESNKKVRVGGGGLDVTGATTMHGVVTIDRSGNGYSDHLVVKGDHGAVGIKSDEIYALNSNTPGVDNVLRVAFSGPTHILKDLWINGSVRRKDCPAGFSKVNAANGELRMCVRYEWGGNYPASYNYFEAHSHCIDRAAHLCSYAEMGYASIQGVGYPGFYAWTGDATTASTALAITAGSVQERSFGDTLGAACCIGGGY